MNKVSPSILSANFSNLISDIKKVETADMLHIDVMDGHFVPNISIGIPVIASISKSSTMFLDVHLMISNPLDYIEEFSNAGSDLICFHIESDSDTKQTIRKIKSLSRKVGLALKPSTPISTIIPFINDIDMVLIMAVEPGFGGQSFMSDMLPKIKEARQLIDKTGLSIDLQVDGGINLGTAKLCTLNGANVLVAGSFIFGSQDEVNRIKSLQEV